MTSPILLLASAIFTVAMGQGAAPEITPIEVKMSSQLDVQLGHGDFPGANCIDGDTETMCHTDEMGGSHPWVALTIPRSTVRQVRITNRGWFCCWERTKNMKVWVGPSIPTTASAQYSGGELLGEFQGPGTKGQVVDIGTGKGLVGSVVVVQMQTDQINLDEIEVFGETAPAPSDRCPPTMDEFNNVCFYFSGNTKVAKWWDAKDECERMFGGYTLGSIGSQEEQDFIVSKFGNDFESVFIGAWQSLDGWVWQEKLWPWTIYDFRPLTFSNWFGSPPGPIDWSCSEMTRANSWQWNPISTDVVRNAPFVCSFPVPVVRLSGNPKGQTGRVELYKDGQWGTLCGQNSADNEKNAEIICKSLGWELGEPTAVSAGSGPIHAGNRQCSGGEASVLDCPVKTSPEKTGCTHEHDQGVHCRNDVLYSGK